MLVLERLRNGELERHLHYPPLHFRHVFPIPATLGLRLDLPLEVFCCAVALRKAVHHRLAVPTEVAEDVPVSRVSRIRVRLQRCPSTAMYLYKDVLVHE